MTTQPTISVEMFDKMAASGVFDDGHEHDIELIRGKLVQMSPINPPHESVTEKLIYWAIGGLPRDRALVRPQLSLAIPAANAVPQPDIAIVAPGDYSQVRPTPKEVFLLIEVSDSSLPYDRSEKAALYAQAGVPEYWIVNVRDHAVEVYRRPSNEVYSEKATIDEAGSISPILLPELKLSVGDLW